MLRGINFPPERFKRLVYYEVLFFVLQPNETGGTGSHQRGEVHVRREQVGRFLPDLRGLGRVTHDRTFWVFHARRAEWGEITYTSFGRRYQPEERLRRFPREWQKELRQGHVLVLIAVDRFALLYVLDPKNPQLWPEGLARVLNRVQQGETFGVDSIPGPDFAPA